MFDQAVKERELAVLANVDADLCAQVAAGLGLPAPKGTPATDVQPSPALSQIPPGPGPIAGRVIGVVAGPGADLAGIAKLRTALAAQGAVAAGDRAGRRDPQQGQPGPRSSSGRSRPPARSSSTRSSIAGGAGGLADIKLTVLLQEAFRHAKVTRRLGQRRPRRCSTAGIDTTAPGILTSDTRRRHVHRTLVEAVGLHRVWDRAPLVMNSAGPAV